MRRHSLTKWLAVLAVSIAGFTSLSQAALTDSVELRVSIQGTKSIVVLGATTYDFGALAINTSSVTASSFTVQNNSPVFIETFTITGANAISDTSGTDWTLASSTGTDQYALAAQFSDARPVDNDSSWSSDDLTTSSQLCSDTQFGNGSEAESGSSVGVNDSRALWFRLRTPSAVTSGDGHTVTVTLSVN